MPADARRQELSDAEWRQLEPLLLHRPRTGRPPKDHRAVLNALWLPWTDAPWRDLPERYGPWRSSTIQTFRRLAYATANSVASL